MANIVQGTLLYASIIEPKNKYQSEEKEFCIEVVVDKATAKAHGKQFPKQKPKVVDTSDFKQIYKIDAPFADEDEQYIIKLKKPAQYKDGTPIKKEHQPKVYIKQNGKAVPLAEGVLVGNGSKGQVSFDITENSYGVFAKLKAVLVEELVEYKKQGAEAASDFGLEVDYGASEFETPEATKPAAKQEQKPIKATKSSTTSDIDDDDIPF